MDIIEYDNWATTLCLQIDFKTLQWEHRDKSLFVTWCWILLDTILPSSARPRVQSRVTGACRLHTDCWPSLGWWWWSGRWRPPSCSSPGSRTTECASWCTSRCAKSAHSHTDHWNTQIRQVYVKSKSTGSEQTVLWSCMTHTCTAFCRFPLSKRDSNASVGSSWWLAQDVALLMGPLLPPTRE